LEVLLLAGLLTGCSSFGREWRVASGKPSPTDTIEGRWEGAWHSEARRHGGRLRCLIARSTEGAYHARFHARYAKIFHFGYRVSLHVQSGDDACLFKGETRLPKWAGGTYRYEGHATPTNFFATYRCAGDHGTFRMERPR
jgi:hypothetical protein